METRDPLPPRTASELAIDQDMKSISAAIEMVASGASVRVTLAGLQFGDALLAQAERQASLRGVRVRPIWPMGDGPVDLVIEAIPDDA